MLNRTGRALPAQFSDRKDRSMWRKPIEVRPGGAHDFAALRIGEQSSEQAPAAAAGLLEITGR